MWRLRCPAGDGGLRQGAAAPEVITRPLRRPVFRPSPVGSTTVPSSTTTLTHRPPGISPRVPGCDRRSARTAVARRRPHHAAARGTANAHLGRLRTRKSNTKTTRSEQSSTSTVGPSPCSRAPAAPDGDRLDARHRSAHLGVPARRRHANPSGLLDPDIRATGTTGRHPDVRLHDLRHTHATLLLQAGVLTEDRSTTRARHRTRSRCRSTPTSSRACRPSTRQQRSAISSSDQHPNRMSERRERRRVLR